MRKQTVYTVAVLAFTIILIACSSVTNDDLPKSAVDLLPQSIPELDIERSGDVLVFVGDSVREYLYSAADFYLRFNFIEAATADYHKGDIPLEVDIFRFDSPLDAHGLYLHLRYGQTDTLSLGVEGFRQSTEIFFAKGPYLVRLLGFSDAEQPAAALEELAGELAEIIPGTSRRDAGFDLFPEEGAIPMTELYAPTRLLGVEGLNRAFARVQAIDTDTVFIFYVPDSEGMIYSGWQQLASTDSTYQPLSSDGIFGNARGFTVAGGRYGPVMGCYDDGYIIGEFAYTGAHDRFLADWLAGLTSK